MAAPRARTCPDIQRDLEAAEQRMEMLIVRWREIGTSHRITVDGPSRDDLQGIEEVLRNQRGTLDRLHQLWIEYAQAIGQHAPQ